MAFRLLKAIVIRLLDTLMMPRMKSIGTRLQEARERAHVKWLTVNGLIGILFSRHVQSTALIKLFSRFLLRMYVRDSVNPGIPPVVHHKWENHPIVYAQVA